MDLGAQAGGREREGRKERAAFSAEDGEEAGEVFVSSVGLGSVVGRRKKEGTRKKVARHVISTLCFRFVCLIWLG